MTIIFAGLFVSSPIWGLAVLFILFGTAEYDSEGEIVGQRCGLIQALFANKKYGELL